MSDSWGALVYLSWIMMRIIHSNRIAKDRNVSKTFSLNPCSGNIKGNDNIK